MIGKDDSLSRLSEGTFDVLVIGGGITGAGVARDAALRGLRVALVERGDYAIGTSSKSSKLVHGGLRYLQYAQFKMVFESVTERALLMQSAPHLVRPMEFMVPAASWKRLALTQIGVVIYDALARWQPPSGHERFSARETLDREPALSGRKDLVGSITYYDCHTDDARLTLENVLDAESLGATCANYVKAVELVTGPGGRVGGAVVEDPYGRRAEVQARVVLSAVGPWTSKLLGKTVLRPTKGVHIVVPAQRLPVQRAMVLFLRDRVIFAIPEGARTVLGTTDTDFDGDPADVHASAEDIRYLLAIARYSFPQAKLTQDDIISTWAGVRPLISSGASSTSAVPREHEIWDEPNGLVVVAGGKLTTYRHMAEEITDHVVDRLRDAGFCEDARACSTQDRSLPGAPEGETVAALQQRLLEQVPEDVAEHLVFNYGARADTVLASGPIERISADLPHLWAEIDYAIRYELAKTVEDVLARRVKLLLYDRDQGMRAAPVVADRIAHLRGLTPTEQAAQLAAYHRTVALSRRWRSA